jgi:hypothetical protein
MVESLFTWKRIKAKHLQAPLLREREQYLTHLLNEGVSIDHVRSVATLLLHVIRLMEFDQLRPVELSEIHRGEELWTKDTSESHKTRKIGPSSGESFHYAALKWLNFLKVLRVPEPTPGPAELGIKDFDIFMKEHQGMSPESRRVYGSRVKRFLKWILSRGQAVSSISISDVDEYLKMEQRRGCLPRTIGSQCVALRLFFRYAGATGGTWQPARS